MARTGENIYHRKDKRWEARYIYAYDQNGKAQYRYLYAKTYAEVRAKLRAATHFKYQQDTQIRKGDDFDKILTAWMENSRLRVKESTYARYRNLIEKHIQPFLGHRPTEQITTELLERYAGNLLEFGRLDSKGGLSQKSVRDILIIIKSVFKFDKRENAIDWARLRLKKEKPEIRVLTRQEQDKLNRVLFDNPDNMKLGILLSLYTGIRIGELCALRWENIDLAEHTLRVQHTMQRIQDASGGTKIVITTPKSNHSIRVIPLPEILMTHISAHAAAPSAFLLTGEKNRFTEPRVVQNHFKRYIRQAGVADANYHCTRHTFATRCVELGCEIKSLSEILGHSVVSITLERYVHSSFDLKRRNMDILSSAFVYSPSAVQSIVS